MQSNNLEMHINKLRQNLLQLESEVTQKSELKQKLPIFEQILQLKSQIISNKITTSYNQTLRDYCLTCNKIAVGYMETNDFQNALYYISLADEKCKDSNSLNDVKAVIYNNLGCIFQKQGQSFKSLQLLSRAEFIEEKFLQCENVENLAETYINKSTALHSLNRPKEAIRYSYSAIQLLLGKLDQQNLNYSTLIMKDNLQGVESENEFRSNELLQQISTVTEILVSGYLNLGNQLESQNQSKKAQAEYKNCLAIAQKYLTPENPSYIKIKMRCDQVINMHSKQIIKKLSLLSQKVKGLSRITDIKNNSKNFTLLNNNNYKQIQIQQEFGKKINGQGQKHQKFALSFDKPPRLSQNLLSPSKPPFLYFSKESNKRPESQYSQRSIKQKLADMDKIKSFSQFMRINKQNVQQFEDISGQDYLASPQNSMSIFTQMNSSKTNSSHQKFVQRDQSDSNAKHRQLFYTQRPATSQIRNNSSYLQLKSKQFTPISSKIQNKRNKKHLQQPIIFRQIKFADEDNLYKQIIQQKKQ